LRRISKRTSPAWIHMGKLHSEANTQEVSVIIRCFFMTEFSWSLPPLRK
jgi:hypothetical protein